MKQLNFFIGVLIALNVLLPADSQGTVKNIKEIFIGRCNEFYRISHPEISFKNCSELWERFHQAFRNRSACDVKPNDYKDFFEYADERKILNKTLFWEATKDTVELITQLYPSFVALGNTIQGYLGNRLYWCGGSEADGINYTRCPSKSECGFEIYYPYWAYASKQFAMKVSSIVYVLLNGSRTDGIPTYSRDSYFATLELPNMNSKTVTELRVWVIYDLDKEQKEKCGESSLVHLAEDTKKFGIKYTCTDNPIFLRPLMCAKYPSAKICNNYMVKTSSADKLFGSCFGSLFFIFGLHVLTAALH